MQLFLGDGVEGVEVEIAGFWTTVISTISVYVRPSKNTNLISVGYEQVIAFLTKQSTLCRDYVDFGRIANTRSSINLLT